MPTRSHVLAARPPSTARTAPSPGQFTPVAAGYRNDERSYCYKQLSKRRAAGRREGWFPRLIEQGRPICRPPFWASSADALSDALGRYREDRTAGQPVQLGLGVEKAGMVEQLDAWYGDRGVPIVALAGFSSEGLIERIGDAIDDDGRPAVLAYCRDWGASCELVAMPDRGAF